MTRERLALGQWGEETAARYLKGRGARILERNYRTPVGEIDIIARYKRQLLFVEVKTRRSKLFGSPLEAVGAHKQRQIIRTAQWYLSESDSGKLQPRFDVLAVMPGEDGEAQIEYLENAFGLDT